MTTALTVTFDAPYRPQIVCLCGSTRFYEAFRAENLRLTLAGRIVLSIGCDTKSDGDLADVLSEYADIAEVKAALDALHLRKIDLADEVFVLNVGGYVGESTAREIAYARAHGVPIRYLEPAPGLADDGDPCAIHGDACPDPAGCVAVYQAECAAHGLPLLDTGGAA